jgi:FkbM family methyltransferase
MRQPLQSMKFRGLKTRIQRVLGRLGYEIHKTRPNNVPINILPMLIQHRLETRDPSTPFFFVDVGANNGVTGDPMHKYVQAYHWRGIFVEPQPRLFAQLVQNYRGEPQLIFENAALACMDGSSILYAFKQSPDLPAEVSVLASFDRRMLVGNGPGYKGEIEELRVPTLTARTLLSKHNVSAIDILQVDTEGFDYEIVRMFLEAGIKPSIIHYESACLDAETLCASLELLTGNGYRLLTIGVDTIGYLQKDEDDDAFRDRILGLK